jgi:divalent metal cation (Fe/Co/Zn/Cd) transporter
MASVIVLIGIFLSGHFWWIDGIMGIIVALMLGYAVFEILKDSINSLLGVDPPAFLISGIHNIISLVIDFDVYPHHFHLHQYGIHQEITFHIRLNDQMKIQEGHRLAHEIEQKIRGEVNLEATIHIDPAHISKGIQQEPS